MKEELNNTPSNDCQKLIGKKFRNMDNLKCHVIHVFKDEDRDIITYKRWSKKYQRWNYNTEYLDLFMIQFKYGSEWL